MKEITSSTGGRYLFFEDLETIQDAAQKAAASLFFGKGNFVISGCEVDGNSISEGYVYLNGKIRYVAPRTGASFPCYIVESNAQETGMYADSGNPKQTAITYGTTYSNNTSANSIKMTAEGPEVTMGNILFNGITLEGSLDAYDLVVQHTITLDGYVMSIDGNMFRLNTGIAASSGQFNTINCSTITGTTLKLGSDANGSIHIPKTNGNYGLRITKDSISYTEDDSAFSTITFSTSGITLNKPFIIGNAITLTNGGNSLVYGMSSIGSVMSWTGTVLETDLNLEVGNSSSNQVKTVSVKMAGKTLVLGPDSLYATPTGGSLSGFDFSNSGVKMYINGHPYQIGVNEKGFLYDMNNPEAGGGQGSSTMSIGTLTNVEYINFKRVINETTYSGQLTVDSGGLHWDGTFTCDSSAVFKSTVVARGTITALTLLAETIQIKNADQYHTGKAGVTNIVSISDVRFQVTSGSSASSRNVVLVGNKTTSVFVGGVLISVTTQSNVELSSITIPCVVTLNN